MFLEGEMMKVGILEPVVFGAVAAGATIGTVISIVFGVGILGAISVGVAFVVGLLGAVVFLSRE